MHQSSSQTVITEGTTASAPGTAFVAGATGYTGREVVRALRKRGIPTIAHVRSESPSLERARADFARLGATTDTTPWTPAALEATLRRLQPTHVFALLGITRKRARQRAAAGAPPESYQSVDYGLTAMLLEATLRAAPAARFIYLSSLGATEMTSNEYVRVRGRIERRIREYGLRALIVRPSFITGPDREEMRRTERTAAWIADRLLGVAAALGADTLRQRYRSRTAAELANAMAGLALQSDVGVRVVDGTHLDAVHAAP